MEKRKFNQRIAIQWSAVAIVVTLLVYHVVVVFREGSTKEAVASSQSILNGVTTTLIGFLGGWLTSGTSQPKRNSTNDQTG